MIWENPPYLLGRRPVNSKVKKMAESKREGSDDYQVTHIRWIADSLLMPAKLILFGGGWGCDL